MCSLPSKTFNALACGTPILALAPSTSALAQLVQEHNCGYVIEPLSDAPKLLVELLIHLASTPAQLQKLSANALAASFHYTPKNAHRFVDAWLGSAPVS
jgi:glycosyltransferase involved in cell wall biosynthesis